MDAFLIMVRNVILFAALAVPGYILVKINILKQEHSAPLSKILMYVGMPFLVISGTVNNLVINKDFLLRMLVVALIGVGYTLALFFVSKPLSSFEKEEKANRMMRFCQVFSNNGFLGIPLAIAVFGKSSEIFTVLIILNIITNVMMYSLGTSLVSGDGKSSGIKKAIFNPVLIAFIIGLFLNLTNIKSYIPEVVSYSDYFSGIVTPVSMTILGMKLAAVKLPTLFTSPKGYYVSALKLIICPSVIVALLFAIRTFAGNVINADVITGFFVAFAMPTAGLASTFADTYGGDTDSAVRYTLGTTIFSILTIPALFGILTFLL
jgi:predicted permease